MEPCELRLPELSRTKHTGGHYCQRNPRPIRWRWVTQIANGDWWVYADGEPPTPTIRRGWENHHCCVTAQMIGHTEVLPDNHAFIIDLDELRNTPQSATKE